VIFASHLGSDAYFLSRQPEMGPVVAVLQVTHRITAGADVIAAGQKHDTVEQNFTRLSFEPGNSSRQLVGGVDHEG
jgi:hypothetical protein